MKPSAREGAPLPVHLIALVVANMIGVGVFTTSGLAMQAVGSRPMLLILWALGGAYALLGASLYGALARAVPESGGEHRLLGRLLHPRLGFAAGVLSLTAGFAGPLAASAHGLDAYTAPGVGGAALALFGLLHATASRRGLQLQTVAVAAKVLLIVVVIGGVALGVEPADADGDPGLNLDATFGILVWITFSYTGWNAAVYLAGEHPPRSVARAGIWGALSVGALYLGLNAVFVYGGPFEAVAGRVDVAVAAAESHGSEVLVQLTRALAAGALITSISSMTVAGARVIQSMGQMGDLGPLSGRLAYTPSPGVVSLTGLALVAYLIADLPALLSTVGWMLAACSGLAIVGGLKAGIFSAPRQRLGGLAFTMGTLGVLVGSAMHTPTEALISVAVFLVAVVAYRGSAR